MNILSTVYNVGPNYCTCVNTMFVHVKYSVFFVNNIYLLHPGSVNPFYVILLPMSYLPRNYIIVTQFRYILIISIAWEFVTN